MPVPTPFELVGRLVNHSFGISLGLRIFTNPVIHGFVFVADVLDVFTRLICGWSLGEQLEPSRSWLAYGWHRRIVLLEIQRETVRTAWNVRLSGSHQNQLLKSTRPNQFSPEKWTCRA